MPEHSRDYQRQYSECVRAQRLRRDAQPERQGAVDPDQDVIVEAANQRSLYPLHHVLFCATSLPRSAALPAALMGEARRARIRHRQLDQAQARPSHPVAVSLNISTRGCALRHNKLVAAGVQVVPKRCFQKMLGNSWQLPQLVSQPIEASRRVG